MSEHVNIPKGSLARLAPYSLRAHRVYSALAANVDEKSRTSMTVASIADQVNLTEKSVTMAIADLVDAGLVVRVGERGTRSRPNVYRLPGVTGAAA